MNHTAERIFQSFKESFSDPNDVLQLSIEETGALMLSVLVNGWKGSGYGKPEVYSFVHVMAEAYCVRLSSEVTEHMAETWQFLLSEHMIAVYPDSNASNGLVFVTKKGRELASTDAMEGFLKARALPLKALHPKLSAKIHPLFIRGEYDTAVFQAYKEVEVSVRDAAGLDPKDIGSPLMRKAFHVDNGFLADQTLVPAERQAMQDLFAGAMGTFKNPQSHRHVGIISPEEAAEMIMLASYLLRIVDQRAAANHALKRERAA